MRTLLLTLTILLSFTTPSFAAEDAVDRVAIASRLVADGLYDRAASVLEEHGEPEADAVDRGRFYSLRGMTNLNLGLYEAAASDLRQALTDAEVDPLLNLYLAQALLATDDANGALQALNRAGESANEVPGAWLLRAKASQALGQMQAAWDALEQGRERFSTHKGLGQQQLLLMVDLGLHGSAAREAPAILTSIDAEASLWIGLGDALRRAGAQTGARWVLEEARLRFPNSIDARVALASACLDADLPHCAGVVLQEAAVLDNKYASEAAECFRRAGEWERAMYANSLVVDPSTKLRQRIGLLIEQEAYARTLALEPRAERLDLFDDEAVVYAFAYAHFRTNSFEAAEALLQTLTDPDLFRQATALREAMARCQEDGMGCD